MEIKIRKGRKELCTLGIWGCFLEGLTWYLFYYLPRKCHIQKTYQIDRFNFGWKDQNNILIIVTKLLIREGNAKKMM